MNIILITQYFWPENFRINDLTTGLKERGHAIEVLTGLPNYPSGRLFNGYGFLNRRKDIYNGIHIHRVPLVPRGSGSSIRLALNFISFASLASLMAPIFCRNQYDVILVYEPSPITVGIPAIVLKLFKSAPIIFWMQDLWPESLSATGAVRSRTVLKLVELLVRLIYKSCDRILVQSRAFIPAIKRLGGESEGILFYPNSAETLYRPVEVEKDAPERTLMPEGFRVMFAGNIGAAQAFPSILSAAERLKEHRHIHWIILGDGRMLEWVKAEVRQRKLEKTFHLLGRFPAEAMPRFFSLSDALLVTLKNEPIFSITIPSKVQSSSPVQNPLLPRLTVRAPTLSRKPEPV